MLLSGRTVHRALAGVIGSGAITAAMLLGGASAAFAQPTPAPPGPPPPECTAAELARMSGSVATATSDYLFSHPDVNTFFTSLRISVANPRTSRANCSSSFMMTTTLSKGARIRLTQGISLEHHGVKRRDCPSPPDSQPKRQASRVLYGSWDSSCPALQPDLNPHAHWPTLLRFF